MGFGHALAEADDVAGAKRCGAVEHASVFRDDMKSALVDDVGEQMAMLFQLIEADVAQGANPWENGGQAANGFFAFLAADAFKTIDEAQQKIWPSHTVYEPQAETQDVYRELFELYRKLYFEFGKPGEGSGFGNVLPNLIRIARG